MLLGSRVPDYSSRGLARDSFDGPYRLADAPNLFLIFAHRLFLMIIRAVLLVVSIDAHHTLHPEDIEKSSSPPPLMR